jgi:hypothetical protein
VVPGVRGAGSRKRGATAPYSCAYRHPYAFSKRSPHAITSRPRPRARVALGLSRLSATGRCKPAGIHGGDP